MRYTLFDRDNNIVGIVNAPNYDAAVASPEALRESARGGHVIARLGDFTADQSAAGDALIDAAKARLAEALGRLGLSEVAQGHAIAGRRETPLERARRDRLAEAAGTIQDVRRPGRHLAGRRLADDEVATVVTKGDKPSGGWDTASARRAADLRAKDASTAAALVRAGYDPTDVARALGMPIKAKEPATAPAPQRPPVAPDPAAPDPVTTTESVRTWGDSEAVTLRETERLEAALGAAFGLTEAGRRHAGRGR